jgi:hypothetical protein
MTLRNPPTEPQIPGAIARDSEVTAAVAAHVAAANPHGQYLTADGIEDMVTGSIGTAMGGLVDFSENTFGEIQIFTKGIKIGSSGTLIKRLLSKVFTIDPPVLASGQPQLPGITLVLPGCQIGDFIQVVAIETDIINTGIWPFEFRGAVTASNTITLYPLNDWVAGSINLSPLQIRVVVLGF